MAISTAEGARYFIGTTAPIDTSSDQSAIDSFEADTYIEIENVEDGGEFGDQSADVAFSPLRGRTQHLKGGRDAGVITMPVAHDPQNAGLMAVLAAEKTKFNYNFKVIYEDAPDANSTDTVDYFRGVVLSTRKAVGTRDNVIRRNIQIGVNTAVYSVDSDELTPLTLSPAAGALTAGTAGTPYAGVTISVSNLIGPPTFAVTSGALPAGLTLNPATGAISGTPTTAGTSNFTVTATDTYGNTGSAAYSIVVSGA